jgi:hypothetical protein
MAEEKKYPQFNIVISKISKSHRKIHRVFRGCSSELECLILSFRQYNDLYIPGNLKYCQSQHISQTKLKAAKATLIGKGFIKLVVPYHGNPYGQGTANKYEVTDLFQRTFNFRPPSQYTLTDAELIRPIVKDDKKYVSVALIPSLSAYSRLLDKTVLSLSNGLQVRPHVDIYRKDGLRLYAYGNYNYQNIDKEWRAYLLIDGQPTVELDYPCLHPNIILNWEGLPSDAKIYETVLAKLRLKSTKINRSVIKKVVQAALNSKDFPEFRRACNNSQIEESMVKVLHRKPDVLLSAIISAYPVFGSYVCSTNILWRQLEQQDSDIMVDVLSTLADDGIVSLPIHDSIVVQAKHAKEAGQVMQDTYQKHLHFPIEVK